MDRQGLGMSDQFLAAALVFASKIYESPDFGAGVFDIWPELEPKLKDPFRIKKQMLRA